MCTSEATIVTTTIPAKMIEYWIFSNEGLSLKTTALELFMGHRGSIAGYLPEVAGTRPRELRSKGPVGKFLLFDEIKILFFFTIKHECRDIVEHK